MTIKESEQEIVEEFSTFTDWLDKYEYLIELGKSLPIISDNGRQEANLIKGCQSRVWLAADYKEGKIYFTADSDAIITRGIVALLIRVLSNRTPEEIISADLYFIEIVFLGIKTAQIPRQSNTSDIKIRKGIG